MVFPLSCSELNITPNYFTPASPRNTIFQSNCAVEGLGLFGRTVAINQGSYARLWTEKQHEEEIQELLMRKEKNEKASTSFIQYEDETGEEFESRLETGESSDVFYLLKETVDCLMQSKKPLGELKKLKDGMLFPIKVEGSEIRDIVFNEMEDQRHKYKACKSKLIELEKENAELKDRIKTLEREASEKTVKIDCLKEELNATNNKLQVNSLRTKAMTFKENMKAAAADYTAIKRQLQIILREKECLAFDLAKEKELNGELKRLNASLLERLGNKSVNAIVVNQSCGTDANVQLMGHKNHDEHTTGISRLFLVERVSFLIVGMLQPKEFLNLIQTAKSIYCPLKKNSGVYSNLLNQVVTNTSSKIKLLEETIEILKEDERRFAFVKGTNVSSDPEFTRLVDQYICKKKVIGSALVKPLVDSRSFIYTGDMESKTLPGKKQEESGGFFSGWGLNTVLNFAKNTMNIAGTASSSKDAQSRKEAESLNLVVNSERQLTPSSICEMLNKMAIELRLKQASKLNVWIKQLQMCFGMLFKGCIQFYLEAKDIEKLKDFLLYRVEDLKQKLTAVTIQKEECSKSLESMRELKEYISKKVKTLDTQNIILSAENLERNKAISSLRREYEEGKADMLSKIAEQQKVIRLLVKKAKSTEGTQAALNDQRTQCVKEFAELGDYFSQIKKELLNC